MIKSITIEDFTKNNILYVLINLVDCENKNFARQVREKFPEVYKYYKATCNRENHIPDNLIGNAQLCWLDNYSNKYVANLFSQIEIGTDSRKTNYAYLGSSLVLLKEMIEVEERIKDYTLVIPHNMGCGLGGGDWKIVEPIVKDVFPRVNIVKLLVQ